MGEKSANRPLRLRTKTKWCCTIVCLGATGLGVATGWWSLWAGRNEWDHVPYLGFGGVGIAASFSNEKGWEIELGPTELDGQRPSWWWLPFLNAGPSWCAWFPLWPIALVTAPVALRLWLRKQVAPLVPLCPTCAYPRAGLTPDAPCPECGRNAPPAGPSA